MAREQLQREFFTVAKLIPLTLLVVAGLTFAGASGNAFLGEVPPGRDFLAAVLIVIFAYGGFEGATIPAGEMRNPRRTISVAVLGTLASVTVFYMLIQYAALRIEPDLAGSDTPLAAAGGAMFAGGLALMTVGAMISIFGTKSGVALTAPRNLYALSREVETGRSEQPRGRPGGATPPLERVGRRNARRAFRLSGGRNLEKLIQAGVRIVHSGR